ncbi:MAG: hypothetical protein Q9M39_09285 [Sulfurovum sp.]|nr:hypothetical protein [Sulfurovum sp.]
MSLLPQYKHIYLSFDVHGVRIIKSPKVSLLRLEQLLLKKATRSKYKN